MGSKGRLPPHHLSHPLPGPGIGHHDPYGPTMRPQHGAFPSFDMLPHPEIMEQKLAAQHVEMQKLATENQRLAATHGNLRQDLAAVQHELQMLHNHVGAVKFEREQQIMGLLDRIGKMEADLQGAETLKLELHQARTDAQGLLSARDELLSRVHQLTEDHQRAHMDLQQIPAMMSELENLRQEYQHYRATYEYEKKLYNDHLESLQVMEKNYMTMSSEVEKLRAELTKYAEADRRNVGPYAGFAGYTEKEAPGQYAVGQNTFDDTYGVSQGRGPVPGGGGAAAEGNNPVAAQPGATAPRAGYDAYRAPAGPAYGGPGSGYDPQRGPGGPPYDPRGPPAPAPYDAQKGPGALGYDMLNQRAPAGPGYDTYRGPGAPGAQYDPRRGTNFESPKGGSGPQGQAVQPATNASYGSVTATTRAGSGFQAAAAAAPPPPPPPADGNHPARR